MVASDQIFLTIVQYKCNRLPVASYFMQFLEIQWLRNVFSSDKNPKMNFC